METDVWDFPFGEMLFGKVCRRAAANDIGTHKIIPPRKNESKNSGFCAYCSIQNGKRQLRNVIISVMKGKAKWCQALYLRCGLW